MSASSKNHRVALVGAGRIAATHLRYIRGIRNAQIVGVCDLDRTRVEEFAATHNIASAFTNLDEMMTATGPSIVHIVTPPATHARLGIRAMELGANILVEKPMAMTVAECHRMMEAANQNGRRLCVDHNRLFDPVIQKATKLVARGAIGDVVAVEAHQGVNPVEDGGGAATGGGQPHWSVADRFAPLYNLGPHPLYLVRAFTGPITRSELIGRPASHNPNVAGELRILLDGEHASGFVNFSMSAQPYMNHVNIFGTKATVRVNLNSMTVIVEQVRKLPKLISKTLINLEPAAQLVTATVSNTLAVLTRRMKLYPGIGETIRRFYAALEQGAPPPVDGTAGTEIVRLLEEICEHYDRITHPASPERRASTSRPTPVLAAGGRAA